MEEAWWERPACLVCHPLFPIVALIAAGLIAFFMFYQPRDEPGLEITLQWSNTNDLDLFVIDPFGDAIYFSNPLVQSGGRLEDDSNFACSFNVSEESLERIVWVDDDIPSGAYQIFVVFQEQCGPTNATEYQVLESGEETPFTGIISKVWDRVLVTTITR